MEEELKAVLDLLQEKIDYYTNTVKNEVKATVFAKALKILETPAVVVTPKVNIGSKLIARNKEYTVTDYLVSTQGGELDYLVDSERDANGDVWHTAVGESEITNIPEIPDSSKSESQQKIYEMFTRDLSMDSRQFSTLDAAVGCFEYQNEYYKGWDIDLRELTPNDIKEYAFTKLLARYTSDEGEVKVFDGETEKIFIEKRIEFVKNAEQSGETEK